MKDFLMITAAVFIGGLLVFAATKQYDTRCVGFFGSTFCGTAITPR